LRMASRALPAAFTLLNYLGAHPGGAICHSYLPVDFAA